MKGASFDRSKLLPLYARIGEIGVPVRLIFINPDGTPHPLTPYDFEIPVRRNATDISPVFTLTLEAGEGLTIEGASLNVLKIEISEENSNQRNETYFWRLFDALAKHTWLNGFFRFHNGEFDGVNESFAITNDMDITITIDTGSNINTTGLAHIQQPFDASDDAFPESPLGSGSAGAIAKGDIFPFSVGGNLPDQEGDVQFWPAGSLAMALTNAPGQDGSKWRILS